MNKTPMEYTTDTHTAQVGNRKMVIRNLTPKLPEEKRKEVKNGIERALFDIFYKYMT